MKKIIPNDTRRKLLKSTLAGGALAGVTLPTRWSQPIIDSMTLPAHAMTSSDFFGSGLASSTTSLDLDTTEQYVNNDPSMGEQLLDAVVPEANAGKLLDHIHAACALDMGDDFLITHQRSALEISEPICDDGLPIPPTPTYISRHRRQGLIPKNGSDGSLSIIATGALCKPPGCNSLTARIINYNPGDNQIELEIDNCQKGSDRIVIPPSNACSFDNLDDCSEINKGVDEEEAVVIPCDGI